jgi:ABC-type lipopolysaccharide export system ATPase subunit
VELARLLASAPHFALLDEPFTGIDPIMVGEVQSLIFHLKKKGIGVLITDHRVRETLEITDRAYIMHEESKYIWVRDSRCTLMAIRLVKVGCGTRDETAP